MLEPELKIYIIEKLKLGWSPELIAGRVRLVEDLQAICHETIYRYIYSPQGLCLKLYKYLRRKRRFRYPRIKRKRCLKAESKKNPIRDREATINSRETVGHWEGDLVHFQHTKTHLFTLRERKARLIVAIKNTSRQAHSTTKTLLKYMGNNLDKTIKTLTLDNDPAFTLHDEIAEHFKAKIYFCEPYKSYQKGGIGNANCLLRTQFPKRTDMNALKQKNSLNDRPMKCLKYRTPNEEFLEHFS